MDFIRLFLTLSASLTIAIQNGAVAENSEICPKESFPMSRTISAHLNNSGIAESAVDDRLAFIDRYISKHRDSCELVGFAQLEKYLASAKAQRIDQAYAISREMFDSAFWREERMQDLRRSVLVNNLVLAREHARFAAAVELFGEDLDSLSEFGDSQTLLAAHARGATGDYERLNDLLVSILNQNDYFSNPSGRGPRFSEERAKDYEEQYYLISVAFEMLLASEQYELASELMLPFALHVETGSTYLNAMWLVAVAHDDETDAKYRLDRVRPIFSKLQSEYELGYTPNSQYTLYNAAMIKILRDAGELELAERLQRKVARFTKSEISPDDVLDRYLTASVKWMKTGEQFAVEHRERQELKVAKPVQPNWPWEVPQTVTAQCECRFNVNEKGRPTNVTVECSDDRFKASAANAVKRSRWVPRTLDGEPVKSYNLVQPVSYELAN